MDYKKLGLALSMASLLSTTAMAKDTAIIIGGGGGFSFLKQQDLNTNQTESYNGSAAHFKIGFETYAQSNQALRMYLDVTAEVLGDVGYFYDVGSASAGLNIEYRFDLMPKKIGLFIGPRLYYAISAGDYYFKNESLETMRGNYEANNLGVGVGAGILLTPAPFFELELKANIPGLYEKNTLRNFGNYEMYEIGLPYSVQVGVNFKF